MKSIKNTYCRIKNALLFSVSLLLLMCSSCSTTEKIIMRNSASEFKNKNYEEVESVFKEMGFVNVECVPLEDIVYGIIAKENEVSDVYINSNNNFKIGSEFDKNSNVTIKYHTKKAKVPIVEESTTIPTGEIIMQFSSKELEGKHYKTVANRFEDAGFANIKYSTIEKEGWGKKDGNVADVTINGQNFKKGAKFESNAIVRITYYGTDLTSTKEAPENELNNNIKPSEIQNDEKKELFGKTKDETSILGTWVQENNSDPNIIYYAAIDEGTITIYIYNDGTQITDLYWTGTFNANIDTNGQNIITSHNYKFITDYISSSSHINDKVIIYENNRLRLNVSYNGISEDIVLKKDNENWAQTINYLENRLSGYNEETSVEFNGLIINLPTYFDTKDEQSTEKTIVYFPKDEKSIANFVLDHILYNEQITQDSLLNISENVVRSYESVSEIKDIQYHPEYEVPCVTVLSSSGTGLRLDAFYPIDENTNIVNLVLVFDFTDKSLNDYIGDFKKVVKNVKVKTQNIT